MDEYAWIFTLCILETFPCDVSPSRCACTELLLLQSWNYKVNLFLSRSECFPWKFAYPFKRCANCFQWHFITMFIPVTFNLRESTPLWSIAHRTSHTVQVSLLFQYVKIASFETLNFYQNTITVFKSVLFFNLESRTLILVALHQTSYSPRT